MKLMMKEINPFMRNGFSNPYKLDEPISKFLKMLGGIFHFNSNLKRNFCKQTVETLIRTGFALFVYVPQKGRQVYMG